MIAALPAVLGFVPERSLVLVTVEDTRLGCVLRVDLSDDLTDTVEQMADIAAVARPDSAIAVIVDEEGALCEVCNDDHRELAGILAAALAERHIDLIAAHVVDRVQSGGRWHCADGCGSGGVIDDPCSSPLAAAAVLEGRRLYAKRAELQAVITPDPVRSADLSEIIDRHAERFAATERSDDDARVDVHAAIDAADRVAGGAELSKEEVARLACALTDPVVRDTLYALAVGEFAGPAEALWGMLARTLPEPWRAEALVLLAFSAYARGDGPLAGVSLEAAVRVDAEHRMAGMLDTALQSGLRPERIRELAATGYRLADRIGVQLPPRRTFGHRFGQLGA